MEIYILILIAIVAIIAIIFFILKSKQSTETRSSHEKKQQVIESYKIRFKEELAGIEDKDLLIQKKTKLLQTFASELDRNIFIDNEEARELIKELAKS